MAKQGLFSLIPEAAAHMNFAVDFVGFFRTPFHCGNQMQNWVPKNLPNSPENTCAGVSF